MKRRFMLPALAFCLLGLLYDNGIQAGEISAPNSDASVPITNAAQVEEHYQQVEARPQFQEVIEPDLNIRLKDWLSQWFKQIGNRFGEFKYSNRMPAFESLLMTVLVVFSLATLLYTIMRLSRRRASMEAELNPGDSRQRTFRPPEFYDDEIQQAIRDRNWHTAWLAAWRQFLARLENHHLVEADRTRTNREYLAQLRVRTLPASAFNLLAGMVDAYDRFIYGRKSIDESDWNLFREQLGEAGLLLHLQDKGMASGSKKDGP
jgi:hypothetical protein